LEVWVVERWSVNFYVAADVGDGFGKRELFGAGLYAILGEAALPTGVVVRRATWTGLRRDLATERGDVHVRAPGDLEFLGGVGGVRTAFTDR
jgi:hypothetical protein